MKKPYIVNITETLTKRVIVWAEDRDKARDSVEDLCVKGEIDVSKDGAFNRHVFTQFKAEDYDLDRYEEYMKE